MECSVRQAAGNYLADFGSTWQEFDKLLQKDGGLNIPERDSTRSKVVESFSFSNSQLQAIVKSHGEARSVFYNLTAFFNKYVRPPLGKLKRALIS